MKEVLTAVYEKSPYGYIGYVEELPGANTQGKTLEETKKNVVEAIQLVLQANRQCYLIECADETRRRRRLLTK